MVFSISKISKNALSLTPLFLLALTACGGGNSGNESTSAPKVLAQTVTSNSDYSTLVQQLYISYFGRPADVGGLQSFQSQLMAFGVSTDLQQLNQAYQANPGVKALIDSFGTSAESAALYSGDNTAFVTAIYKNVLNRTPGSEGLKFWVNALDSGTLTRGNASPSIMAGALVNTSQQGQADAVLINNKIKIGSNFTTALLSAPVNGYSGKSAAAQARAMLASVTSTTDVAAFQANINKLIVDLVPGQITLSSPPDAFFGGSDTVESWPYSSSGSKSANLMCVGNGCAISYDVATFKLSAEGKNYTIDQLTAVNTDIGSTIQPSFNGLSNGMVIPAGQSITFRLQSPFTRGNTVNLKYSFVIKESGEKFDYSVQLRTN